MPLATLTPTGPDPPLKRGEFLTCARCHAVFSGRDVARLWNSKRKRARCPECKHYGQFVRHASTASRTVAGRWGLAAEDGWTPIPNLLLRHQRMLQLDTGDLNVLVQLEQYRREAGAHVYPKVKTLATQSGMGERTIRKHIARLEQRGLIEVANHRREDGATTSNRYRRDGLDRVLQLIATNAADGREPDKGLDEMLEELASSGLQRAAARRHEIAPRAKIVRLRPARSA